MMPATFYSNISGSNHQSKDKNNMCPLLISVMGFIMLGNEQITGSKSRKDSHYLHVCSTPLPTLSYVSMKFKWLTLANKNTTVPKHHVTMFLGMFHIVITLTIIQSYSIVIIQSFSCCFYCSCHTCLLFAKKHGKKKEKSFFFPAPDYMFLLFYSQTMPRWSTTICWRGPSP